jgi:hypothetical protein
VCFGAPVAFAARTAPWRRRVASPPGGSCALVLRRTPVTRCAVALLRNGCRDCEEAPCRVRVAAASLTRSVEGSAGVRLWQLPARTVGLLRYDSAPARLGRCMDAAPRPVRQDGRALGAAGRTFASGPDRRERRAQQNVCMYERIASLRVYYTRLHALVSMHATRRFTQRAPEAVSVHVRLRVQHAARKRAARVCARCSRAAVQWMHAAATRPSCFSVEWCGEAARRTGSQAFAACAAAPRRCIHVQGAASSHCSRWG